MSTLLAIRPGDQNLPLFIHVAGAMLLVGGLLTATSTLFVRPRGREVFRLGYFALVAAALPGWVAMFAAGEWLYHVQGRQDRPLESAWLIVGFVVAEAGLVVLVAAVILGAVGLRRQRTGRGATALRATMGLATILLVANLVAAWAMAGKPG